jgi:hypothetical protein
MCGEEYGIGTYAMKSVWRIAPLILEFAWVMFALYVWIIIFPERESLSTH